MATPLKKFLLILTFVSCGQAFADTTGQKIQIHARTGMIDGKYSGLFSGKFSLTGAMDLEVEFFLANKGSFLFRFVQAFDSPDSRPYYTYAGSGGKYYFWGRGTSTEQEGAKTAIIARPTFRAYVGGDFGVAQVLVKSFGPTVQAVANMLDAGVNVGVIYQVSKSLGVEAQVGMTYGYGISSVNANGTTQRALLGVNYAF